MTDVRVDVLLQQVDVAHTGAVQDTRLLHALNAHRLDASIVGGRGDTSAAAASWEPWGAAALLLLAMGMEVVGGPAWLGWVVVAVGGVPLVRKAWAVARMGRVDMHLLMLGAVVGALALGQIAEAASVVAFFGVAGWLEARTLSHTRREIAALATARPLEAVLEDGSVVEPAVVKVGTRLLVRPGATVPLDGDVVEGRSTIDESPLTGESLPVDKRPGSTVHAGTTNHHGALVILVTSTAEDTDLARLSRMVDRVRGARSGVERWVDRLAARLVPTAIVVALAVAVLPPLMGGGTFHDWAARSLVVLVLACPCAMVISTPVAVLSALARAARSGVLVRGGEALEALASIRTVAFDKTGTVTTGRFEVVHCHAFDPRDEQTLHEAILAVERRSSHPVASALVHHSLDIGSGGGGQVETEGYATIDGEGVSARVGAMVVHLGNHRLAERMGWHHDDEHALLDRWTLEGRTVVYAGVEDRLLGLHALADVPRDEAQEALEGLRQMGMNLVMLTGDNAGSGLAVGRAMGVADVSCDLKAQDKLDAIRRLRAAGPVAMVGDGINDGPALAAADVAIAMGGRGTALALQASDVVLMKDDLRGVPEVIDLARRTRRVVAINLGVALGLKLVVGVLALIGRADLWMAVASDVGATLLVTTHSLWLLRGTTGEARSGVDRMAA